MAITKDYIYIEPLDSFFRKTKSNKTKDWENHAQINIDKSRRGYGEHGVKTHLNIGPLMKAQAKMIENNGHNVLVSDRISVERGIPDFRSDV